MKCRRRRQPTPTLTTTNDTHSRTMGYRWGAPAGGAKVSAAELMQ